jgi:hypothetical protein
MVTPDMPPFILNIGGYSNDSAHPERICIEIDQGKIWEAGDKANDLFHHITDNLHVTIDNSSIYGIEFAEWATIRNVIDNTGQVLGSYGGEISACFDSSFLESGLHNATIEIKSTSGRENRYSWTFEIVENPVSVTTPEETQTPVRP